jgi:hypothetical protein
LRTVIGVFIQTRVAHPKQMRLIRLPFDRVAGKWLLTILQGA